MNLHVRFNSDLLYILYTTLLPSFGHLQYIESGWSFEAKDLNKFKFMQLTAQTSRYTRLRRNSLPTGTDLRINADCSLDTYNRFIFTVTIFPPPRVYVSERSHITVKNEFAVDHTLRLTPCNMHYNTRQCVINCHELKMHWPVRPLCRAVYEMMHAAGSP